MSMMDRIYAQLLNEMRDLEDFVDDPVDTKVELITQTVTIKYELNGQPKYLDLSYVDIKHLIERKAEALRRELAAAGKCDAKKSS